MEPAVTGAGAAADPAQAQKGEELLQHLELVVALTGTQNIQAAACVQAVQADKVRLGVGTVGHTGLGLLVGLAKALVQLVQRVGAAVQAGGVAVEFGDRDPGKLFDRFALNGGKFGRGCGCGDRLGQVKGIPPPGHGIADAQGVRIGRDEKLLQRGFAVHFQRRVAQGRKNRVGAQGQGRGLGADRRVGTAEVDCRIKHQL